MVSLIRYFVASLLIGFKCFLKSIQFFLGILHFGVHILFRASDFKLSDAAVMVVVAVFLLRVLAIHPPIIPNPHAHKLVPTMATTSRVAGLNMGCLFARYINLIPFNFFYWVGPYLFFIVSLNHEPCTLYPKP
jgi:hypothetical protein